MVHFDRLAKAKLAGTLARVRAPHSNVAELCRFCESGTGAVNHCFAGTGATTCRVTGSRVPARAVRLPTRSVVPPTHCRSIWSIVCSINALAQVPLTDDKQTAVEDGAAGVDSLLAHGRFARPTGSWRDKLDPRCHLP